MDYKFSHPEKIIESVSALRDFKGRRDLIFVSGCFDILHIGHLDLLRQAKEVVGEDGSLLVALHDDESIKENKGESRPINSLEVRMDLLTELTCVDYVMPWYGWKNIADFVVNLSPPYIAVTQGGYRNKSVRDVANSIGASLKVVRFREGFSTSEIIKLLGEESL